MRTFQPGEQVSVQTSPRDSREWTPGRIITQWGPVTYLVDVGGREQKRHVGHIRAHHNHVAPTPPKSGIVPEAIAAIDARVAWDEPIMDDLLPVSIADDFPPDPDDNCRGEEM